jgi:sec-independent protein translocase protein TatA
MSFQHHPPQTAFIGTLWTRLRRPGAGPLVVATWRGGRWPAELLIILPVVLLLFGSKKLPELARGTGQAATEFRKGLRSGSDEAADSSSSDAEPKSP